MAIIRQNQVLSNVFPNQGNQQFLGAQAKVVAPPNLLTNSSWVGMSGSVSGADFVFPDGWTGGFWPPDEAITIPNGDYNALETSVNVNRGYLQQTLNVNAGDYLNVSCFISNLITPDFQRPIAITSPDVTFTEVARQNNNTNVAGRRYGTYLMETSGDVIVRVGCGTLTNTTQSFTISRPQVTVGTKLYPYAKT